jgi:hypothetical protein
MKFLLPVFDPVAATVTEPTRPVEVLQEETGIRIILDSDGSGTEPDLLIERLNGRWLVLVHRDGDRAVLAVEIKDDGTLEVQNGDGDTVMQA